MSEREETYYQVEIIESLPGRAGKLTPLVLGAIRQKFNRENRDWRGALELLTLGGRAVVSGDERTVKTLLSQVGREID